VFSRQPPRSSTEIIVTTSLRIASIASIVPALALALSTAAGAATVRLVPLSPPSIAASITCTAVPASISAAAPAELPTIAAEQNVTGITEVRIDLDAAGRLTKSSVLASSGNRWIDRAALRAARSSRYSAEVRDCAPAGGAYAFVVDFTQ
jgi:TonB family protein